MKKMFFILIAMLFAFTLNLSAQQKNDSTKKANFLLVLKKGIDSLSLLGQKTESQIEFKRLKIYAGFFLVPVAEISLVKPNQLFSPAIPFFLAVLLEKRTWAIAPCYLFNNNSAGVLIEYQLFPKFGMFLLGTKSTLINSGKIGFALTVKLGGAKGFVEYGMPWDPATKFGNTSSVSIGAIIPVVIKVKK